MHKILYSSVHIEIMILYSLLFLWDYCKPIIDTNVVSLIGFCYLYVFNFKHPTSVIFMKLFLSLLVKCNTLSIKPSVLFGLFLKKARSPTHVIGITIRVILDTDTFFPIVYFNGKLQLTNIYIPYKWNYFIWQNRLSPLASLS
jgi:hypothetical protein